MRAVSLVAAAIVALAGACNPPDDWNNQKVPSEDPYGPVVWHPGTWSLGWQDEFDGPAGAAPDPTRWAHEIGGWGWGNGELQYYTDSTSNAALDGEGHLLITALEQTVEMNAYTSARLTTKGLFTRKYGRFEARMRLVAGRGLWPAFWIMGDDIDTAGWPGAGEMDIMENRGNRMDLVSASVHGPVANNIYMDSYNTHSAEIPGGADADFHVYAVEWDPANIVFLVDDNPYLQITPKRRPYAAWVFDHPFFMIINLAVGGIFPGYPDATTTFPRSIAVDYVRVSARVPDAPDAGAAD
jgi:beta-glucanase (GH16 family)